jgi:hypothetical protein
LVKDALIDIVDKYFKDMIENFYDKKIPKSIRIIVNIVETIIRQLVTDKNKVLTILSEFIIIHLLGNLINNFFKELSKDHNILNSMLFSTYETWDFKYLIDNIHLLLEDKDFKRMDSQIIRTLKKNSELDLTSIISLLKQVELQKDWGKLGEKFSDKVSNQILSPDKSFIQFVLLNFVLNKQKVLIEMKHMILRVLSKPQLKAINTIIRNQSLPKEEDSMIDEVLDTIISPNSETLTDILPNLFTLDDSEDTSINGNPAYFPIPYNYKIRNQIYSWITSYIVENCYKLDTAKLLMYLLFEAVSTDDVVLLDHLIPHFQNYRDINKLPIETLYSNLFEQYKIEKLKVNGVSSISNLTPLTLAIQLNRSHFVQKLTMMIKPNGTTENNHSEKGLLPKNRTLSTTTPMWKSPPPSKKEKGKEKVENRSISRLHR